VNWEALLTPVILALASAIGVWATRHIKTPSDVDRAALLAQIAKSAAALVVNTHPNAPWATLLEQTVQQIAAAAGVPTKNGAAIQRAAAEALEAMGRGNAANAAS